jgi:hypothetical protein
MGAMINYAYYKGSHFAMTQNQVLLMHLLCVTTIICTDTDYRNLVCIFDPLKVFSDQL